MGLQTTLKEKWEWEKTVGYDMVANWVLLMYHILKRGRMSEWMTYRLCYLARL